ncbi:UDP-N-acetylmuramyl tripeptide synthetase [Subtercola boreus]|uniref:Lipid II isoglutaminyl synthase (glutamine-hydrolyzing) subunit MurT n=2 Tax=Subtercola boreus TaxID=120213 RepID=A0A3E0WCF6_9MICO|nr:UDP-N-acetylmuramyl tripeptide synthetase [Subtercola boreus]RFA20965.1 UDP-N-acetylmuramyl tripeptide synthetase [Subtercola boreus]RFA27159.1 UDP-N-acetylmuramyl tripeptide synthetase [Subtercola boreus]
MRGGGSAIPGTVALRIAPRFLEDTISAIPRGVVAISGSNGKSTTTNMLAAILREHGLKVFTNPSGGNLPQGIASSVLSQVSLGGKLDADIAILEVDEGYGPRLAKLLKPRTVLLLNIQIDQLNRYHEPDRVVRMLEQVAMTSTTSLILNRDDNHLVDMDRRIPGDREVSFFGASPELIAGAAHGVASADRFGDAHAEVGAREAAVTVTDLGDSQAVLAVDGHDIAVRLPARGLHYALDAAGATATARSVMGAAFRPGLVTAALNGLSTVYGRGELLQVAGESIEIIMMKNPASLQLNLDSLGSTPEQVFMAVDEGTPDPSWIYDIDFSSLSHVDVITGSKAWQFAVRLGYADIPVGSVDLDVRAALKRFLALPRPANGRKTMILNYEQMMGIRKILGFKELEGGGQA